jgi:23S rRNA (guanosine2251-2'-O)-methyltransferase
LGKIGEDYGASCCISMRLSLRRTLILCEFYSSVQVLTSYFLFPTSYFRIIFATMRKLSMAELGRKTVEEFKQAEKNPLIVVLDNIRSVYNVGSVFRTADAFLVKAICICGYSPTPDHRQMAKTALGATDTVDWIQYPSATDAVNELKNNGYKVYAVEQAEGSISLENCSFGSENIAVVFGNEVVGVQEEVLKMCDGAIEIPQLGMKHSLNIATAAGIVLWKLSEQRFHAKPQR